MIFLKKLNKGSLFAEEFSKHEKLFNLITDKSLIDLKNTITKIHYQKLIKNKILKISGGLIITAIITVTLFSAPRNEPSENDIVNKVPKKNRHDAATAADQLAFENFSESQICFVSVTLKWRKHQTPTSSDSYPVVGVLV